MVAACALGPAEVTPFAHYDAMPAAVVKSGKVPGAHISHSIKRRWSTKLVVGHQLVRLLILTGIESEPPVPWGGSA
jgi:hypothetical protein